MRKIMTYEDIEYEYEANYELPEGASLHKCGDYLRINNAFCHPISNRSGSIPFHRFILFEKMGRPSHSACQWCGYVLPWKTTLAQAQSLVVNADHLNGIKSDNNPDNLVPSCGWCNVHRNWAELHDEFWGAWRKWLKDVPPNFRPNLVDIAHDNGIETDVSILEENDDL
jgi:hypothetical protein